MFAQTLPANFASPFVLSKTLAALMSLKNDKMRWLNIQGWMTTNLCMILTTL